MLDLILGALIIFAAITGFRKGFLKSLIGMFGNFIALICSYSMAAPVASWLNTNYHVTESIAEYVRSLLPMPTNFSHMLASFEGLGQLYTYLDNSILPDSIKQSILMAVQEQINAVGASVYTTMADIIANTVATSVLQGIVFIGQWALLCVVMFFISHVLAGVVHLVPVIGLMDRLCGMMVALVLISITMLILYKGISVLGLMEGSLFAESQILHFCSQLLNPEVTAV